ncbi:MAG: hypothetical protein M1546_01400 [Chloroflexi bacterium]|nr:hypothetical protein [Chloroflexota bacterium]
MVIRVQRGPRKGDTFDKRDGQPDDIAIVEKLIDQTTKSTIFIAAGVGASGTVGALYYLMGNWRNLSKRFDSSPFAICIRFQDIPNDANWLKKPIELAAFHT